MKSNYQITAATAETNPIIGTIHSIAVSEIHPFACSPFKVRNDDTGRWKQYANRVNRYLPQYNIKCTTSAEEKGVAVRRNEPVYRYILKCCDCGNEIKRQKKSVAIEHPERYHCKCGGKLIRVQ